MTKKSLPSPPLDKLWGKFTGHALSLSQDRLGFMMKTIEQYGDFVELKMGTRTTYLLADPNGIDYILRKNAKNYSKDTPGFQLVSEVTGKGVFTESGSSWLEKRKKVNPFFSNKNKNHWLNHIKKTCEELKLEIAKSQEQFINICPLMTKSTLQILGRTIFNEDLGKHGEVFEKELNNLIYLTEEKITQILPIPSIKKFKQRISFERSMNILDEIIIEMIDRAKSQSLEPDKNMIHTFLALNNHKASETKEDKNYIVDQIKTMAFAGHETSSNVLSWTLYLILKHEDWYSKIYNEISHQEIDINLLDNFPILTMAIKESMRLYPPAWSLGRKAEGDDIVCRHNIRKGDIFIISPYLVHHNKKIFKDPFTFDPKRFSKENEDKILSGSYIPFGLGPRSCIGEGLAMMEIIAILVTLIKEFKMSLKDNDVQIDQKLTLQAKNGIYISFKEGNK